MRLLALRSGATGRGREIFLFLAIILIGIANIASLPPFEGLDEFGHYSSMRQIADTGVIPLIGRDDIDQWIKEYRKQGPFHYTIDRKFFQDESITYADFFKSAALTNAYAENVVPAKAPSYAPSATKNWIAQHPPLYYIAMAGVIRLTNALTFMQQLFVLRLVSFLMAAGGLLIGLKASSKAVPPAQRRHVRQACLLFPLIIPMFFPEFARLGNDSLCLLIMGVVWSRIVKWHEDGQSAMNNLALGIGLALGLLTKALFIPVVAGLAMMSAVRIWKGGKKRYSAREELENAVITFTPVLFAGVWYLKSYLQTSSPLNYGPFVSLGHNGGLIHVMLERGISWWFLILNTANVFFSWVWAGTQSLAVMPFSLSAPVYVLVILLLAAYGKRIKTEKISALSWAPVWLIVPFVAGLMYHVLMCAVLLDQGSTPGWYLSVMAPMFGYAFAEAFEFYEAKPLEKKIIKGLLVYDVVFIAMTAWAQMSLFAGCATEKSYMNRVYAFEGNFACLDKWQTVLDRMSVIAWPRLALAAYALGIGCLLLGIKGGSACAAQDKRLETTKV